MKRKASHKAGAKINLFLEVCGKREDGYNEIKTIFSKIELYDNLNFTLTKNRGVKILTDTDCLKQEDNLIYKIAVFIQNKYNVKAGVLVELEKKIPLAAGLGGGSSDAAATIDVLDKLWGLELASSEKQSISSSWGSDISFFLHGSAALGEGRGELITPLQPVVFDNILLVNPGFGISSAEAYRLVERDYEPRDYRSFLQDPRPENCFNRLEIGIRKAYPAIDDLIMELESLGATKAMLSGSGATVIGFCPDQATTRKLSQYYTKKEYWNTITKTKGEPNEHYRC